MYCAVGGDESESRRMRDVNGVPAIPEEEEELLRSGGFAREDTPPEKLLDSNVVCLLMYVSARVRAPAVDVVEDSEEIVVLSNREDKERRK